AFPNSSVVSTGARSAERRDLLSAGQIVDVERRPLGYARGDEEVAMTKILTPTAEHDIAGGAVDRVRHDGLWMSPADAGKVTGWTLKPEGMCRAEACVPLPASAVGANEVDVAAFWTKLGGPVIASEQRDVWALGAPADERNAALAGL